MMEDVSWVLDPVKVNYHEADDWENIIMGDPESGRTIATTATSGTTTGVIMATKATMAECDPAGGDKGKTSVEHDLDSGSTTAAAAYEPGPLDTFVRKAHRDMTTPSALGCDVVCPLVSISSMKSLDIVTESFDFLESLDDNDPIWQTYA